MHDDRIFEIEYYLVTDIGPTRSNQEDNFLLPTGEYLKELEICKKNIKQISYHGKLAITSGDSKIFTVADGMGGHNSGEVASACVVNNLKNSLKNISPGNISQNVKEFDAILKNINADVFNKAALDISNIGMGSTLASVLISENKAVAFNVGDSRVYYFKNNNLTRLSKDHTDGQRLIDLGIIENDQSEIYKSRGALTRFIGMSNDLNDNVGEISDIIDINDNDIILLCTDGLSGFISDDLIQKFLSNFKEENLKILGQELLKKSLDKSLNPYAGSDNITIILLKFILIKNKTNKQRRNIFARLFKRNYE